MQNSLSTLEGEREKLLRELEEIKNSTSNEPETKKQKLEAGDVSQTKESKIEMKRLKKEAKAKKREEKERRKSGSNNSKTEEIQVPSKLQEEKERLLRELSEMKQEAPKSLIFPEMKPFKSALQEEKESLERELNGMQETTISTTKITPPKSQLQEERERLQRELNATQHEAPKSKLQEEREKLQRELNEMQQPPKSKLQEEREKLQRELNEMQQPPKSKLQEEREKLQRELNEMQHEAPKSNLQLEKERLERELNDLQEPSGLKRKHEQLAQGTNPDLQENTIVFIGNLSWKVQNEDVEKFFEERGCAPIHNIRWINDQQTGLWKGCGHITFPSSEMAINAVRYNGTIFMDGRAMKLELPRVLDALRDQKRIYISGVPQGTDAEEFVRNFFIERGIPPGEIDTINIVKESFIFERKMHTGECYVLFRSVEAAKMAIQAADKERGIEIRLAKEFKPKNVEKTTAKPATLFIGGEAFASGDVRARIIEEIFGEFGEIDRIRYGTNRKCVFVEYAQESSCENAIKRSQANPFIIHGKRVLIDRARA